VVCAGAGHHALCTAPPADELAAHRTLMEVNYFGAVAVIQAALPLLLSGASRRRSTGQSQLGGVLVLGSVSGELGLPARSGYCATKHALSGYLSSLQRELVLCGTPLQITNVRATVTTRGFIVSHMTTAAHCRWLLPLSIPAFTAQRSVERRSPP
jgi:dehydrogenase/reductase SDR family protein 7